MHFSDGRLCYGIRYLWRGYVLIVGCGVGLRNPGRLQRPVSAALEHIDAGAVPAVGPQLQAQGGW